MIKNLCIFCGASEGNNPAYAQAARTLGSFCAGAGLTVVYGGGRCGLMGVLAETILAENGEIVGVIPEDLKDREMARDDLSALHLTKSLHERQKMMADLADAFVILPGGIGSLAEFFEILTWRQLGYHEKPVFILNTNGYWDLLLAMLDKIKSEKFLHRPAENLWRVIKNVDELQKLLEASS